MLEKLRDEPKKIPSPSRNEMMRMLNDSLQRVNIDNNKAFKSVWVTNSLNGSEDYLVSDRPFSLVGESMREFRNTLMTTSAPKTIIELVRKIIPPKGIKRKNAIGAELCDDGEETGLDDELNSDDDIDPNVLLAELGGEITIETVTEEIPTTEINTVSSGMVSLVGISGDDDDNKDARFLDAIGQVLRKHETSLWLTPFLNQIKVTHGNARRNLKKRIQGKTSVNSDWCSTVYNILLLKIEETCYL